MHLNWYALSASEARPYETSAIRVSARHLSRYYSSYLEACTVLVHRSCHCSLHTVAECTTLNSFLNFLHHCENSISYIIRSKQPIIRRYRKSCTTANMFSISMSIYLSGPRLYGCSGKGLTRKLSLLKLTFESTSFSHA